MSYHRAPAIDANQPDVVRALELAGWYVYSLASIGGPVDLLVTDYDVTWLCEVKNGALCPGHRRPTKRCYEFLSRWPGQAAIVLSADEAQIAGDIARRGQLTSGIEACRRYVEATGGVQR